MSGQRPCQQSAKLWIIKELASSRSKTQSKAGDMGRQDLKLRAREGEVAIKTLNLRARDQNAAMQLGVTCRTLLHNCQWWQQLKRLTEQCYSLQLLMVR